MENTRNGEKRRKSEHTQLIMVHHKNIVDNFFLYKMGWIMPKTTHANVPFYTWLL
jgi:hypothetical protein